MNIRGAITVYEADFHMNNCVFKDIYSDFDGGGFFISQTNGFIVENTNIYNITARRGVCKNNNGGFLYVTATSDKNSHAILRNIKHIGSGIENIIDFTMNGVISCVDGYASLEVENYYGEKFYTISSEGSAFVGSGDAKITIRNLELTKVTGGYSYGSGLLLTTYNPIVNGVTFNLNNCTMTNIIQYSDFASSLFTWVDKGSFTINNCNVKNAKGTKSHIHYQGNESKVTFNNVIFDSISSNFPVNLINLDSPENNSFLHLNNVKISKVSSPGVLFRNNVSLLKINGGQFENIHTCMLKNTCVNYEVGPAIGITENFGKTYISNSKFINIYGGNFYI
ncbi:hypothetical protein PIROE2DRAFT_15407 [Piromyces sp. E2]|nr:hypothetical protein PIROE2DRAFT_15407 [Piromyces sp. E2]|eukprot:OUM59149.1 hypothetical protein PIROE2DRAFT_15407 [Piromyces sp. E2]